MSQTINCHPFCVFWNRECYQMLPNVLEVTDERFRSWRTWQLSRFPPQTKTIWHYHYDTALVKGKHEPASNY